MQSYTILINLQFINAKANGLFYNLAYIRFSLFDQNMNIEDIRAYCLSKKGVSEDFPFDEVTLVFRVMQKIFLFMPLDAELPTISAKCDPERAIQLREEYPAIRGGYHLNKKHWNSIDLDGTVNDDLVLQLIDHSYELIVKSLTKKLQKELDEL